MALLSSEFSIQFLISFLNFFEKKKIKNFNFLFPLHFSATRQNRISSILKRQNNIFNSKEYSVWWEYTEKWKNSLNLWFLIFPQKMKSPFRMNRFFQKLLSFPKAKYRKLCKCHFGVLFRWETSICFFQNPHPHKKKGV